MYNSKRVKDIRKSKYVSKKIHLNMSQFWESLPPTLGLVKDVLCIIACHFQYDSRRASQTLRKKSCETELGGNPFSLQLC